MGILSTLKRLIGGRETASPDAPTSKRWKAPGGPCVLPEDQAEFITTTMKCPYCLPPVELARGPKGGASINLSCTQCGSRFNVVDPVFGITTIGEYLGNAEHN